MIELNKTPNGLRVHEREVPVMDFYDVVVIGGGVAGVAAGMAAAKRGMKTIILETFTALGGLTTLGLVNIPLDFILRDELALLTGIGILCLCVRRHRGADEEVCGHHAPVPAGVDVEMHGWR